MEVFLQNQRINTVQLKVAREWLEYSKRAVVEAHVSPNRKKNAIKNEEVGKIPNLCLHLQPYVIAKAMPKGCQITIEPQTDGYEYCWVMSRNGSECKKLSNTFENKKVCVGKGKQKLLEDQTEKGGREMGTPLKTSRMGKRYENLWMKVLIRLAPHVATRRSNDIKSIESVFGNSYSLEETKWSTGDKSTTCEIVKQAFVRNSLWHTFSERCYLL